MKNVKFAVYFSTAYLFVFALLPLFQGTIPLMFLLFSFSPLVVIWLVFCVLVYGEAPQEKFSDGYWYSDIPYPVANPCTDKKNKYS
jgi:hypothetical protein